MIIDSPSLFAALPEWRDFLEDMEVAAKTHPEAQEWVEVARAQIEKLSEEKV